MEDKSLFFKKFVYSLATASWSLWLVRSTSNLGLNLIISCWVIPLQDV